MTKKREVSSSLRDQSIGLFKANYSFSQISKVLSLPKSTIQYIVNKWKRFGDTKNAPRSGRPRKISKRGLRVLIKVVRENRWSTLGNITTEFNKDNKDHISSTTIRRRLNEYGFRSRIPARKPLISENNRKKRLVYYNLYKSWSLFQWTQVIWSDESRFNLLQATDGKTRVWRLKNERYNPNCISKTVKWNGGGVMIWGSFCNHMLGPCYIIDDTINSNVYIENILTPFYSKFYLICLKSIILFSTRF